VEKILSHLWWLRFILIIRADRSDAFCYLANVHCALAHESLSCLSVCDDDLRPIKCVQASLQMMRRWEANRWLRVCRRCRQVAFHHRTPIACEKIGSNSMNALIDPHSFFARAVPISRVFIYFWKRLQHSNTLIYSRERFNINGWSKFNESTKIISVARWRIKNLISVCGAGNRIACRWSRKSRPHSENWSPDTNSANHPCSL